MLIFQLVFISATYHCAIHAAQGALNFTKSPTAPKALIKPLVLSCSIEPTNNHGPESITVGKGSDTVIAKLKQPDKTQISFGSAGYTVDGVLSNTGPSYIKLMWQRPSVFESGTYFCDVRAQDATGKITTQSSTINVTIQKPTFEDLLYYSRKQGDLIEEQDSLITDHSKQLKEIQDRLRTTTHELADTNKKVAGLVPKVEEGQVQCGNSLNYTFVEPNNKPCLPTREEKKAVVFSTPYATAPAITLTASTFDIDKGNNTRMYFRKQSVTEKGFEIVCGTWCDTQIYVTVITWQARNN